MKVTYFLRISITMTTLLLCLQFLFSFKDKTTLTTPPHPCIIYPCWIHKLTNTTRPLNVPQLWYFPPLQLWSTLFWIHCVKWFKCINKDYITYWKLSIWYPGYCTSPPWLWCVLFWRRVVMWRPPTIQQLRLQYFCPGFVCFCFCKDLIR